MQFLTRLRWWQGVQLKGFWIAVGNEYTVLDGVPAANFFALHIEQGILVDQNPIADDEALCWDVKGCRLADRFFVFGRGRFLNL